MPSSRTARILAACVSAFVAISSVSVATSAVAGATPAARVHYAVNRPLCSTPHSETAMRCYGVKAVPASKGTRGAYRYTPDGRTGALGGFSPRDLAAAYRYNPKLNRRNMTVGIVLWHDAPTVLADLNRFNAHYHLPRETSRSFRKVNERGRATPLPGRDRGSAGEIALDTQAVRAVCNTCRILLVEADGPYDSDLANAVNTAVRLGANVVTNSYGTPERRFSAKILNAYRHPGVAVVAATGDSGWFGWDFANNPHFLSDSRASFPASSPFVIAVGGTTLDPSNSDPARREMVWNNNGAHDATGTVRAQPMGATGGGCSRYFAAPTWQSRSAGYAAANCHGKRLVADMSMVADPRTGFDIYDSYGSGGWVTVGGTSLSSPLAAGLIALAGGAQGSRYPASALYANASANSGTRYDVTLGGNGFCHTDSPSACAAATRAAYKTNNPNKLGAGTLDCSFSRGSGEWVASHASSECTATRGLDGPSGVGSPRSTMLFKRSDPYLSVTYRSPVRHGNLRTFRPRVTMPVRGTRLTSLTWSWGDHHTNTRSTAAAVAHTYRKKGSYTLTLTSRDSRGQISVLQRRITVR